MTVDSIYNPNSYSGCYDGVVSSRGASGQFGGQAGICGHAKAASIGGEEELVTSFEPSRC